jgi:hypothetical protein
MADIEHSDLGGNANQHAIHRWAHADQAARFAQAVAASDVGKVSKQASNNTFWVLVDHTQVGSSAGWKELSDVGALAAAAAAQSAANAAQVTADTVRKFNESWGNAGNSGVAAGRFFSRLSQNLGTTTVAGAGDYPCHVTGTFTFTLTVRITVPLSSDSVTFEIYKNGLATGISLVMAPTVDFTKQASGSLAVVAGDGISVRVLQSSTEAVATTWNCSVNVSAV